MNAAKNLWYDHGAGRGGTIIDLAMELEGMSGAGDAIRSISLSHPSYAEAAKEPIRPRTAGSGRRPAGATDGSGTARAAMEMVSIGRLASAPLVRYIEEERGIPPRIAAEYLVEARYRSPDGRERFSL